MKIQLSKRAIRAALEFAATQDIRYYLNGIKVEATKAHTTYIATDGSRLIVIRHKAENELSHEMIISTQVAKLASKGRIGNKIDDLVFVTKSEDQHDISTQDGRLIFNPIEGNFPLWKKVANDYKKPKKRQANSNLCINPVFLKKCYDALIHLGQRKRYPAISLYESEKTDKAVNVQCGSLLDYDVFMIVMPCREQGDYINHDWINEND